MEHIVLRAGLGGDGALEVHGLADIRVVLIAVIVGGVLLDGLDVRGNLVLLLHHHVRIGGVQGAQRAQRGVYQIVAQIQTGEGHRGGGGHRALVGDAVLLGILLRGLCEGGGVRAILPGHIALRIHLNIGALDGVAVDEAVPRGRRLVGIGVRACVVALQIQDLVDGVGLSDDGVIDGDAATCSLCESHGQHQNQNQGNAQNFLHWFVPFLSPYYVN